MVISNGLSVPDIEGYSLDNSEIHESNITNRSELRIEFLLSTVSNTRNNQSIKVGLWLSLQS
jgi:hypothetical protein